MSSFIISLLLGGMLSRVAGPIAQDFFENETQMGRRIARRKDDREIEKENRAYLNRIKAAEKDHQLRLDELRMQIEKRREEAETQYFLTHTEAKLRSYLQDCWPLRNPFDAPLAIEPIYDDATQRLRSCKLKTVVTSNQHEIVPLRFISAHLDNAHPLAATINSELSMFLIEHYKANEDHGVISEIGAWKPNVSVNDASISYLFQGMKGQPVMVMAPEYINNGAAIRFKLWSWGLGENLTYPVGFDFGTLDLNSLYNRIVASENNKMSSTLKKVGMKPTSDKLVHNEHIISLCVNEGSNLSSEEKERILTLLTTPTEINNSIRYKYSDVVSNVFKSIVAMYTDGYHLIEFGTLPKLPNIIDSLGNLSFMYREICAYYTSLLNAALLKGIITSEDVINIELTLCEKIKQVNQSYELPNDIIGNIRLLNTDNISSHRNTVIRLRGINNLNNNKKLTNGNY